MKAERNARIITGSETWSTIKLDIQIRWSLQTKTKPAHAQKGL